MRVVRKHVSVKHSLRMYSGRADRFSKSLFYVSRRNSCPRAKSRADAQPSGRTPFPGFRAAKAAQTNREAKYRMSDLVGM